VTDLVDWGWDERWTAELEAAGTAAAGSDPAVGRVTGQDRDRWTLHVAEGAEGISGVEGAAVGRITTTSFGGPFPVTGDWVTVRPGPSPSDPLTITGVLPRRSAVSRGSRGEGAGEQVLASNVDVVWIVHGLDSPPNARRLERYLAQAWDSGAVPEVVLTKSDLAESVADAVSEVEAVAMGVTVHVVSVEEPGSVRALRDRVGPGRTVALLGMSGAGKSTLINALADEALAATAAVRESDLRGRHTTTRRELFRIPGGALLMDTPGLRELRIWALDDGLARTFPEIEELAGACRFGDCRHETEPGCAVLAAVESGALAEDRLASFRKLKAEADYMERRSDPVAQAAAVAKHKTALKTLKYHPKYRD